MADDGKKTFTEDEHLAILSDRVSKETATLTGQVETLTTSTTELQNKLDVEQAAREAAEAKAAEVQKAFDDFKAEIETREAAELKKDERVKALRESAKHLKDDFLDEGNETGKARVARIVAMSDEAFEGYKADLASTGADLAPGSQGTPRETAMHGAPATTSQPSAARSHLLRGRLVDAGASKEI